MTIMKEEIFGPLLPIVAYNSLDEVVQYINRRPRPLALYLFTRDRLTKERIIRDVMSGGVAINDCMMQVGQHDLPFGGIGDSGTGHYHGYEGFCEFSKLRPVFYQAKNTRNVAPPYHKTFDRLIDLVKRLKWLS